MQTHNLDHEIECAQCKENPVAGDQWEAAFRETYELKMKEHYDTHFYVGTINQHPKEWIVVGLFYPPRAASADAVPMSLF